MGGGSVSAGHALDVQALRLIEHDLATLLRGETLSVDDELALLNALESAVASKPLQFLVGKGPTGRLRPSQVVFLERIRAAGGVAFMARDCRDVRRELQALEGKT